MTIYDYVTEGCNTNGIEHGNLAYESTAAVDLGSAIGESFGAIVCEVKCIPAIKSNSFVKENEKQPTYEMKFRYYIIDIYEWAYHYDREMKYLHNLHECGLAHQFLMSGYLERTMTWEKGEISSTLITENSKLMSTLYNYPPLMNLGE